MSDLVYALIQSVHNLGAVAVVGLPAAALARRGLGAPPSRMLTVALALGWTVLAASGVGFGLASLGLKGALPEIDGVARWALAVKLAGAFVGLSSSAWAALGFARLSTRAHARIASCSLIAAAAPLAAAAVLRWYL